MGAKDVAKQAGKAALDYAKNYIKNGIKNAAKEVASKLVASPYFWAAVGIILLIMIITGMCVKVEAQSLGNTDGMTSASSSAWEQFIKYLHQCEGGGTVTKNADGVDCYTVQSDGGGGSAVGYGVDIATFGQRLRNLGYKTSIGSLIPVDVVDAIEKEEVEARYNDVVNLVKSNGIELTEYQIFALVSRTYNYGFAGGTGQATGSFKYPSTLTFVEAYKKYYSSINNNDYYGDYTKTDFNNKLFTQYMTWLDYADTGTHPAGWETRRKSEWCLFQTGYYGWGLKNGNAHPVGFDEYWKTEYNNVTITYAGDGGKGWTCNEGKVSEKFKSNITSLTHSIIYHAKVFGQGECNKGAAFAIASAYTTVDDAVSRMPRSGCLSEGSDGAGSVTVKYFKKYGLNAKLHYASDLSNKVAQTVENGGYVAFHLNSPTVINGKKWTGNMHWLCVLSVRQKNGKIEMYVADDSRNQGNPNARWLDIKYFDGSDIDKIWVITQAK